MSAKGIEAARSAGSSSSEAAAVDAGSFSQAASDSLGQGVAGRSHPTFGKQRQNCVLLSRYLAVTQEWSLSCTNFADGFWRVELNAGQAEELLRGASVGTFRDFFAIVRNSLLSNSLFMNLAPGRSNLEVRFTSATPGAPAADETFLCLPKITLFRVDSNRDKLSLDFYLALVDAAQSGARAADELLALRAQMASAQAELTRLRAAAAVYHQRVSADFDDDDDDDEAAASGDEGARRAAASPASASKTSASRSPRKRPTRRQPGYSLLNPSVKLKKPRGVRYGEALSDESD